MQQQGFRRLVSWLERQRGDGLHLTPQIPATVNEDIREEADCTDGIIYDLAYNLGPFIQATDFTTAFFDVRKQALNTLYINHRPKTDQQYPETLPVGGGNESWDSSWSYRFYTERDRNTYDVYDHQSQGERALYVADFDSDAVLSSTTVTSVDWEVLQGTGTGLANQTLTGNVATALISFDDNGIIIIRARATYANFEVKDFLFHVEVAER